MNVILIFGILLAVLIATIALVYYYGNIFQYFSTTDPVVKTQLKKIDDYNNNITVLTEIEAVPIEEKRSYDAERELYELYYTGIPDTYDNDGNIIPGVKPNPVKAIEFLTIIINSPEGTEQDTFDLAKLYHYGMHDLEVDIDKAELVYNGMLRNYITDDTRQKVEAALADIMKIRTYRWLNLPSDHDPTRRVEQHDEPETILNNQPYVVRPTARINETIHNQPYVVRPVRQVDDKRDNKKYNDPQNVHDSQVLGTIRHSLNNLKKTTKMEKNLMQSYHEIKTYIGQMKNSDKKRDALVSLEKVIHNIIPLSSLDTTEGDALNLVWNRINGFDTETSDNLKETLFEELASMQEHGSTVCSTGRFTRIVDTLNGVDEAVSIKPTYAVNEEMLGRAAKIRGDVLAEVDEVERDLLERGTSSKQDEFDNKLKGVIIKTLHDEYVKTSIISNEKFRIETDKWINEI